MSCALTSRNPSLRCSRNTQTPRKWDLSSTGCPSVTHRSPDPPPGRRGASAGPGAARAPWVWRLSSATGGEPRPADLLNRLAQRVRGRHGIRAAEDPVRQEHGPVGAHRDGALQALIEGGGPHREDDDFGAETVLQLQRHLEGVRIRRVNLAWHPDPLERLRDRVHLELLRPGHLFDADDNPPRSLRGPAGRHIDRAPCRRSRSILSFGTPADAASSKTTSTSRSFPAPSTVYMRSAISISMRGYTSNKRSFFMYKGARRNRSKSVSTFRRRRNFS